MNKITFAIIAITALVLTGCSPRTIASQTTVDPQALTESTSPTETIATVEITVPQKPMLALSLPVYCEQKREGDVVIFEHIYQGIDLTVPEQEIADRITKDFHKRIDTADMAQQICEWAVDSYPIFADSWARYLCQVTYEPMRFDGSVLSLYGTHAYFADMHFTEGTYKAVTYDMTTGKAITLTNVLTNISRDELIQTILDSLEMQAEGIELYDDYRNTVKQRFSGSLSQDTDWYLGDDGLYFFFSPYEIAPRSTGVITVQIPYSQLAGKMDDAYFPPEQEFAQGNMQQIAYTDESVKHFSQIAGVVLKENEFESLLYTNLSVANIRLEMGIYDSNLFIPQYTVFSTPVLTPGDAVILECGKDDLANLRLTYSSDGKIQHLYFDANGKLLFSN